jgi:hypothetical protein
MNEESSAYVRKLKRAVQLLLFQRHRAPGVKGWELRRSLGKNYMKVIELLNEEFEKLGLQIKIVYEEEAVGDVEAKLDRARFFVTLKGKLTASDLQASGWRIDDVAALAAALAYLNSRQGKAPRGEVERLLSLKLPSWRVRIALDRFVRLGYLKEEDEALKVGWRAKAEVNSKALTEALLALGEVG